MEQKAHYQSITPEFPNALRINGNYDRFFDYETGELKEPYCTEIQQEQSEKAEKKEKQKALIQPKPQQQTNKPHPTSTPAPTDPWDEAERIRQVREEAKGQKEKEEQERNFQEALKGIKEYKLKSLKEKIQGDELERQKELFGTETLSEFQTQQARRRLEKVFSKYREEENETTKQETAMKQVEENKQQITKKTWRKHTPSTLGKWSKLPSSSKSLWAS